MEKHIHTYIAVYICHDIGGALQQVGGAHSPGTSQEGCSSVGRSKAALSELRYIFSKMNLLQVGFWSSWEPFYSFRCCQKLFFPSASGADRLSPPLTSLQILTQAAHSAA